MLNKWLADMHWANSVTNPASFLFGQTSYYDVVQEGNFKKFLQFYHYYYIILKVFSCFIFCKKMFAFKWCSFLGTRKLRLKMHLQQKSNFNQNNCNVTIEMITIKKSVFVYRKIEKSYLLLHIDLIILQKNLVFWK